MEDHESRQERHRVGHEVRRTGESETRYRAKAHGQREVMGQACRGREEDDRSGGNQPEWQGFFEQVWPARPFPRPTAQYVADDRSSEPGDGRGNSRPHVHGEAGKQRRLARGERHHRAERKPGEPPAHGADAERVHCPDNAVQVLRPSNSAQRKCHGYLSLRVVVTDNSGSIWASGQDRPRKVRSRFL